MLTVHMITRDFFTDEEDFEVHHIVDDDLEEKNLTSPLLNVRQLTRTSNSCGLLVSQLRVHPTVLLNLASRLAAKASIAVTAV